MSRLIKIGLGIAVFMIIVGGLIGWRVARRAAPTRETVTVSPTTLEQNIEFTGRLQAHQTAELGFETTGIARTVNVAVGDVVTPGQVLVTLDPSIGQLEVAKAEADLASAMDTAATTLANAQTAQSATQAHNARTIETARQDVRNKKKDLDQAKIVWDQTVRESGGDSAVAKTKYALVITAESAHKAAQVALKETEKSVAESNDAAQATVDSASITLKNTQQRSASASGLSSLAASEAIAGVRLSKNTLRAPFLGVVTEKNINTGEVAATGQSVVTIQTVDETEVVASVAETDVTKLSVGLPATITLDAYEGEQEWRAEVVSIDPAAVLLEGVPTYRVRLKFLQTDPKLLPGLTANVNVHAARKENVLAVPRRAVLSRDNKKIIRVMTSSNTVEERLVSTGLVSSTGHIEITQGLYTGDVVIIKENE